MNKSGFLASARIGALLFALLFCEGVLALQKATIRFNPEAPFSPLEQEPGEIEAYQAVLAEPDVMMSLSLISRFLADYPSSEFRHLLLRARWQARIAQGAPRAVIEAAQEAMEAEDFFRSAKLGFVSQQSQVRGLSEFKYAMAHQKAAYYQSIFGAFRDLGDFGKMAEYGELGLRAAAEAWDLYKGYGAEGMPDYQAALERNREIRAFILFNLLHGYQKNNDAPKVLEYYEKILELTPNDLQTLMAASRMMAEQPPAEGANSAAYIERAQRYAEKALEQLKAYYEGANTVSLDDARKTQLTAEIQHTLGLIHFRLGAWEKAVQMYAAAIEAVPDNPLFYFMRGLASRQLRDADALLSAYARAVYLGIPQPKVRADLETIYKAVNGSLEGLNKFIDDEGSQIGINSALQTFRKTTAYIEKLIDQIEVLPAVFPPNRFCDQYYEFLASQDLQQVKNALEIGVGSGINSLILLDRGVPRLVGTDINENAVRSFKLNAARFGYAAKVDVRLVPLDKPEAFSVIEDKEKFDLIISNPPWEASTKPKTIAEYAYLDREWVLLRSMLAGFADHLTENGRVWLLYGDPRLIPSPVPPAVEIIMREAPNNDLNATVLYSNARCSIVEITVRD